MAQRCGPGLCLHSLLPVSSAMVLLSAWACLLYLSVLTTTSTTTTTTIAFVPASCRTTRSNTCTTIIDGLQNAGNQKERHKHKRAHKHIHTHTQNHRPNDYLLGSRSSPRGPFALPVLEATKVEDPVLSRRWYPEEHHAGNDDFSSREELEGYSSRLMAELIGPFLSRGLRRTVEDDDTNNNNNDDNDDDESEEEKEGEYVIDTELLETANQMAYESAKGRFVDFCGEKEGEKRLESFFLKAADTNVGKELLRRSSNNKSNNDASASASASDDLVRFRKAVEGAVVTIQSLLVYAMTYGLTLNPTGVHRAVAHMKQDAEAVETTWTMDMEWTPAHSLRLKYLSFSDHDAEEKVPGLHLLSVLKWKRTPLRAYELLVQLGVWTKHENLTLLRSGIPLRFTEREEEIASRVARESERERKSESKSKDGDEHENDDDDDDDTVDDPDTLLGIRRDLRSQKIYTIDSASTKEIDDGLGVEILEGDDGNGNGNGEKRYRYWIHIADADRWAKRDSELFQIARRRATSIYLPGKSIPMMPSSVSQQILSLRAQKDVCALSLGVELNDDGSIIEDSIVVTPSTVRVTYRLTYDDADEMLEDGIGYNEEWELGQLYTAAQRRRQFRIDNGSAEDFVPNQIPQYTISTFPDRDAHDEIGIKVDVQVSHNGGKNQSSAVGDNKGSAAALADELPVSSSFLLVTEMMILSGEAIGKWAVRETQASGKSTGNDDIDDDDDDDNDGNEKAKNSLELPFRSQEAPDYRSRARERNIMTDLLECNIGGGYCHAWYSRRFFSPAKISPDALPHSGLGLGCYVQWTSPIRRFQDLQVHAAVKRFVRRQRVMELIENGSGEDLPSRLLPSDLGCDLPSRNADGKLELLLETVDEDIDYGDKTNLLKPAQFVMRNSNKFWMLEYIRRLREDDPQRTAEVLVLGCVNPSKKQYAVYLYEFGLEWRYNSPVGIQAGDRFVVRFGTVLPQNGQMTLIRVAASGSASGSGKSKSKNSGRGSKQ